MLAAAGPPPATARSAETPFDALRPPAVSHWPEEAARRGFLRALAGTGRLTVLALQEEDAAGLVRGLSWGRRDRPEIRLVVPSAASRETLQGPLLVMGTFGEGAAAYLSTTPCRRFDPPAPGETVRVMSVNPWDRASPMLLLTGAGRSDLEGALASGPWLRGWDYEVIRDGVRVRYGRFAASAGEWRIDPQSDNDIRARIRSEEIGALRVDRVEGEVSSDAARAAATRVRDDLGRFVRRLMSAPPVGPRPAVHLILHADRETKGIRTGDPRPGHVTAASPPGARIDLHLSIDGGIGSPEWSVDHRLAVARAALRLTPGEPPPRPVADGAAVLMAGGLLGRDLGWWESRLGGAVVPPPDELWRDDDGAQSPSYLVLLPLRARALARLEGKEGTGTLGALLRRAGLPERLAREAPAPPPPRARGARRAEGPDPAPPQKGMGLAHEGYGVMDGYGSRNAVDQMRRLKDLGVGWVALSPYGFMPDPRDPSIRFNGSEEQGAGTENDHAVLATMRAARAMGLRVLLKPQIWLSRGHWTGDVTMETEPMWRGFFGRYRDFLAHYALLAAAGDADLLSVGVELSQTSRREADWRALIATARELFDGPLTYAANWGSEFETLSFWDALDFAGLDCYYPLSDRADPTDEDLLRGARLAAGRAEEVFRRTGRRVLLTEVGFPALSGAWVAPHDDARDAVPDTAAQARAYRAILEVFTEKRWLAGIYWWKWPTTPPAIRPDPLFSPRGRPAERVLAEWYGRWGNAAPTWPSGSP